MLNHLHIQNYRLFRDLHIDKLGQVNLIAGKNNTGKTALLEAIWINENAWNESIVSHVIFRRGDFVPNSDEALKSLFYEGNEENKISIGTIYNDDNTIIEIGKSNSKRYNNFGIKIYHNNKEDYQDEFKISGISNPIYPAIAKINSDSIYIPFDSETKLIQELWNAISLTPNEENLVDIMRIIQPNIQNLRVDNGVARILLKGKNSPIPLKNLGDGANRLLTLALALVNSKDKMLLIDEFEVGLHYSVQEQLWEIIFKYAKEWNIQVFVTTHSKDTLRSFYYVAAKTPQYQEMANYFTLNRKSDGDIRAVNYDLEDIETSILANLEIR
jgi:AAA15 family ATPase/GTPase